MAIGRRDLLEEIGSAVFFGGFAMAAQRAVRKLLLAVVALYLLFLISVWHVVNRSSARSIAYGVAAWFVSAPQPAARRLEATSSPPPPPPPPPPPLIPSKPSRMAPAGWCVRAALPRLDAANAIGERVLTVARAVEVTPFCERPLNQVMDMLLPPRAGEPLRAAQPVHIRA